jgi:hypothetical protein
VWTGCKSTDFGASFMLAYSSTLKIKTICSSETSVDFHRNTRRYIAEGRSQWSRGQRHEPSSPASTLESWVRIPLVVWMSMCVYSVCAVLCVGSGLATA